MKVELAAGVVGQDATHWGMTPDGFPVVMFQTARATVRVEFTPDEAKEHGCAAIYLATEALLARQAAAVAPTSPAPGAPGLERSSSLVGVDGLPLVNGRGR